jgi:hypothetical protein
MQRYVVDGNFTAQHMTMKQPALDIALSDGLAYMVANADYQAHLLSAVIYHFPKLSSSETLILRNPYSPELPFSETLILRNYHSPKSLFLRNSHFPISPNSLFLRKHLFSETPIFLFLRNPYSSILRNSYFSEFPISPKTPILRNSHFPISPKLLFFYSPKSQFSENTYFSETLILRDSYSLYHLIPTHYILIIISLLLW